jgi:hypothetical protein
VEPADQGVNARPIWDFTTVDDVVIHNHSDAPVFDLDIDSLERASADRMVWENLGDRRAQAPAKHTVFRAGETTGRLTVVGAIEGAREASNPTIKYLVFTFTDANGRRWRRQGTDQPVRVFD